ncbi:SDR family oxidoreductase [Candidatus Daviesbacteria bacterium]|nr:SDR family oxidoreductase [Candidatus Daviesbacteria bacterium]
MSAEFLNHEFSGMFVAVTGSARLKGYGSAIAKEFANRGAAGVVIMSRDAKNADQAERILGELQDRGSKGFWFQGDLTDEVVQGQLYRFIKGECGQLNALVNNAGALVRKPFSAIARAEWNEVMDVNARTAWELTKGLYRLFPREQGGAVVNVGSVVGPYGNRGQIPYVASKAALIGVTRSLALELAGRNIRVNQLNPGYAETDMTEFLDESTKAIIAEHTPLGRIGTTGEVAYYVVNFCSPRGAFATGAILDVDGGIGFANIGIATNRAIEAKRGK